MAPPRRFFRERQADYASSPAWDAVIGYDVDGHVEHIRQPFNRHGGVRHGRRYRGTRCGIHHYCNAGSSHHCLIPKSREGIVRFHAAPQNQRHENRNRRGRGQLPEQHGRWMQSLLRPRSRPHAQRCESRSIGSDRQFDANSSLRRHLAVVRRQPFAHLIGAHSDRGIGSVS